VEVSGKWIRNQASRGFLILAKALPGASDSMALERIRKRSQQWQLALYCRHWESKMIIPVQ
jgi:hypothetical protein